MNKQLQDFARQKLKEGLAQLPEAWQYRFKQMYAHQQLNKDINEVVDAMEEERLDWAMQQVERSIAKLSSVKEA